jgi:predicted Zn-ribbon and HTH transcriptional regulator
MKVFFSWSTPLSGQVAEELSDFLERLIQSLKPFLSQNMEKGTKWAVEIDNALEGTNIGIVCLTPENLASTWIHFEAGAISKVQEISRVCTFLVGTTPSQVVQPLSKFQATLPNKSDVLKLVMDINSDLAKCGFESRPLDKLKQDFEDRWPKFDSRITQILEEIENGRTNAEAIIAEPMRNSDDMIVEILEILRSQQRQGNILSSSPLTLPHGIPYTMDKPLSERGFINPGEKAFLPGATISFVSPSPRIRNKFLEYLKNAFHDNISTITWLANEISIDFIEPISTLNFLRVLEMSDFSGSINGWRGNIAQEQI